MGWIGLARNKWPKITWRPKRTWAQSRVSGRTRVVLTRVVLTRVLLPHLPVSSLPETFSPKMKITSSLASIDKIAQASFATGILLATVILPEVLIAAVISLPPVRVEDFRGSCAEQTREWSICRGIRLRSLSVKATLFVTDKQRLMLMVTLLLVKKILLGGDLSEE
ncbi:hypothetical protein CRG98_011792 [Punica granatum]|uniref:Uncharacterized protein n=1 Tax=Punica granatum TaxID=22663 RepID=A0A2I0KH88_PUNGR|nr:hypothetical protein CRG98_011792 [Punica granatum]